MAENLEIEKISQLRQNDSVLGNNDEFIVNREISPGVVKTRRGKYGSIFGPLISGVQTAISDAANALGIANSAQSTATSAQNTANTALSNASTAQNTANTALSGANAANAWIASPISSNPGNIAALGTDSKIFVPGGSDFITLTTLSSAATIANTNAETIFPTTLSVTPANNLVGAMYEAHFNISKGPSGHNSTIRLYINTANNLTGSPVKVLEYSSGFNSNTSYSFMFRYFRNAVGLVVPRDVNAAQTVLSNLTTQSLVSTTPITFSNANTYFFIITTQMSINTSNETLQFAKLCLTK
jgi:hypothetical protein